MKKAKELYKELIDFFVPEQYEDVVLNGILADNTEYIDKVYTSTFSSSEALEEIKRKKINGCLLFTHHPGAQHDEDEPPIYFTEIEKKYMEEHKISHFNLHLPLDQINPYSPSICFARVINAVPYKSFFHEGGAVMGLVCTVACDSVSEILNAVELAVGHKCKLYDYGDERLKDGKIAIIAGGAEGTAFYDMLRDEEIKLFITGVGSKDAKWFAPSHHAAEKNGVSILAAGHYSTEHFALKDICRFFEERGVEAEFLTETPRLTDL